MINAGLVLISVGNAWVIISYRGSRGG